RRHTRSKRDWSSDVCSSDLAKTNDVRQSDSTKSSNGCYAIFNANYDYCFRLFLPGSIGIVLGSRKYLYGSSDSFYSKTYDEKCRSEERRVGKECRYRMMEYE